MKREFTELFSQNQLLHHLVQPNKIPFGKHVIKHYELNLCEKNHVLSDPVKKKPVVKLNKQGEIIRQIEISCQCGEKVFIDLEYDEQ